MTGNRAAHLLSRFLTALCVIALLPALALWILSYASPRQFDHYGGPVPAQDQLRLVLTRGAVWYLHLQTHPADGPAAPAPPGPPTPWTTTPLPDPAWDTRFKPDQTGPIRFGFAHKVRPLWRSALYIDPRTGNARGGGSITEERIVRFPLAAPIAALLLWPLVRIAHRLRRRRGATRAGRAPDPPAPTTGPFRAVAGWLFGLTSLASALLLAVAIGSTFASRHHAVRLTCAAAMPGGVPGSSVSGRFRAGMVVYADGWELARTYQSDAEHRLPPRPTYDLSFEVEPPGVVPTTALAGYTRADVVRRLLGFAVGSQDVPPLASMYMTSRFISPDLLHRTGQAILVPHWATCLATAILPAAWLARQHALRRRARRLAQGFCQHCGYDLRATPDRCPECGAKPSPASAR